MLILRAPHRRRAGLKHIVKLSQYAADTASPVRFLRYHAVVERAIKDGPTPATPSSTPSLEENMVASTK
ncbi:MAG TPA: hypothetical protein VGM32_03895 [Rhodopila sp.]|jgi:uncharacterized protein YbjT (DUF2867 family)